MPAATRPASSRSGTPTGSRAVRPRRGRLPRILGFLVVGIGSITVLAVILTGAMVSSAVSVLSVGLPDPGGLEIHDVRPADRRLRPFRHGRARPVPARVEASGRVRRRAGARAGLDDDRRGPVVLGEQRLRRAGDHVGPRPGRQRRPGAGCLDDHPAARPGAAPARRRDRGRLGSISAQGQGDHPVDAPVGQLPGRSGQGPGHHRLSQRDLLRPWGVWRGGCRPDLLRGHRPGQADPRAGGVAGGPAEVTVHPRPVPLRREGQEGPAGRAGGFTARGPARLDPRRPGRGQRPLDPPDPDPDRGGEGRAGHPRRRPAARVQGGPLHLAGPPSAGVDPGRRGGRRDWWLHGHHDPGLESPAAGREVARGRCRRAQPAAQEGRGPPHLAQGPQGRSLLGTGVARQGPPQRRDGRPRLQERRRPRLRRQRGLRPGQPDQREVLAQVRRGRRRRPAAGLRVQADPVRGGLRQPGADARQPAARRHHRVQPGTGLGAPRRRPAGARAGPRPQGTPVFAEHPGRPGPGADGQRPSRQDSRGDGHPVHRRPQGLPAGRAGRRARDRRSPADRPDVGISGPSPTAASTSRPG